MEGATLGAQKQEKTKIRNLKKTAKCVGLFMENQWDMMPAISFWECMASIGNLHKMKINCEMYALFNENPQGNHT